MCQSIESFFFYMYVLVLFYSLYCTIDKNVFKTNVQKLSLNSEYKIVIDS